MTQPQSTSGDRLLTHAAVRDRLGGVSGMHIWRLLNNESYRHLDFPQPLRINGRMYWRESELDAWLERQFASRSAAEAAR